MTAFTHDIENVHLDILNEVFIKFFPHCIFHVSCPTIIYFDINSYLVTIGNDIEKTPERNTFFCNSYTSSGKEIFA